MTYCVIKIHNEKLNYFISISVKICTILKYFKQKSPTHNAEECNVILITIYESYHGYQKKKKNIAKLTISCKKQNNELILN